MIIIKFKFTMKIQFFPVGFPDGPSHSTQVSKGKTPASTNYAGFERAIRAYASQIAEIQPLIRKRCKSRNSKSF